MLLRKGSLEEFCGIDSDLCTSLLGSGATFPGCLDLFDIQFRKDEI